MVLIGGKLQYLVPSLIALRALRRTGCTLPAELWFPDNEHLPGEELQTLVHKLGAHIRTVAVPRALGHVCSRHKSAERLHGSTCQTRMQDGPCLLTVLHFHHCTRMHTCPCSNMIMTQTQQHSLGPICTPWTSD